MGYWKQQLIAQDIEVGDRVATPSPWYTHAALTRRNIRHEQRTREQQLRQQWRDERAGLIYMFLLGVMLGASTMSLIWWVS